MTSQNLGIRVLEGMCGGSGVQRFWSRALSLAALGLALVTLLLLGGRVAPVNAQGLPSVEWYDLPNYGGASRNFSGDGIFNLENDWYNDRISSIQVSPGWKVALYSDAQLSGVCEVFTASDPDLSNNRIGSNAVSSMQFGADCGAPVVRLFEHPNYGGAGKVVAALGVQNGIIEERADLGSVGFNDTVTSIQVPAGQKVSVWADANFRGRCETFTASDADLRDNWIGDDAITSVKLNVDCPLTFFKDLSGGGEAAFVWGDVPDLSKRPFLNNDILYTFNDSVSSLQVPKGMMISVYSGANYTGTCETFTAGDHDLRDNWVGNDTISSLKLNSVCPVALFEHLSGGGAMQTVQGDVPDLRSVNFNDTATSLQVSKGQTIAVYRDINYTGVCETVTATDPDLRDNRIGNDTISSVRIGRGC